MAAGNINSPVAVVAVYQDPSGAWRMVGTGTVVSGPVSMSGANSPLAFQALSQSSAGLWDISGSKLTP